MAALGGEAKGAVFGRRKREAGWESQPFRMVRGMNAAVRKENGNHDLPDRLAKLGNYSFASIHGSCIAKRCPTVAARELEIAYRILAQAYR